jgi:hypothetical protein
MEMLHGKKDKGEDALDKILSCAFVSKRENQ